MKPETASLLAKHHLANRFKFIDSEIGLELEHDLSDAEKMELVQTEYSPKGARPDYPVLNVDELFVKIMKEVIKLAADRAKDQLSEL